MEFHTEELTVSTSDAEEIQAITGAVADVVEAAPGTQGVCLVYSAHTTATVIVNEDDQPLYDDFFDTVFDLIPRDAGYRHNAEHSSPNAHAHILAMLTGNSCTVPVVDRTLALGTWQDVLFVESDGPQDRTVIVQVLTE
jgi:secondary thiamine-phosphate synthase enzyme